MANKYNKGFTPLEKTCHSGNSIVGIFGIQKRSRPFRVNSLTGFTVVELFFWLLIIALVIAGLIYKSYAPRVQKAPLDGTPDIEASAQNLTQNIAN